MRAEHIVEESHGTGLSGIGCDHVCDKLGLLPIVIFDIPSLEHQERTSVNLIKIDHFQFSISLDNYILAILKV